ncbi:DUF3015 family protein [Petrachloros mirabilis]
MAGTSDNTLRNAIWAGMFCFALSGCTVTETINDVLSSTTPGGWFTGDGLLKPDQKVNAFVTFNFENVKQDMAQGHGEYLTSLSTLMGVSGENQASFFTHAQSQYPVVIARHSTPQELIALLKIPAAN